MIESLIALFSIFLGVLAANIIGFILKKVSISTSNSIAGVFGSILLIKSFSWLGFAPKDITGLGSIEYIPLIINWLVSTIGGALGALIVYKIQIMKNKKI